MTKKKHKQKIKEEKSDTNRKDNIALRLITKDANSLTASSTPSIKSFIPTV